MSKRNSKTRYDGIDAVDLFCGGGGLTCGLRQTGIDVRMGVDFDGRCEYAYEHNNHARFLHKSVTDVTAKEVRDNFREGHVSLLAGCAPCQTFSKYNQKATWRDKRWLLLDQFTRLVIMDALNLSDAQGVSCGFLQASWLGSRMVRKMGFAIASI